MTQTPPRVRLHYDADIEAVLADLNTSVTGLQPLKEWAAQSSVPIERCVDTPSLTYVRLAGHDDEGGSIVLMRLENYWERAI